MPDQHPFRSRWIFAGAVIMALAILWLLAPRAQPSEPTASAVGEPAREALYQLLNERAVLDQTWRDAAAQWPAGQSLSDQTRRATENLWPSLLNDMLLLEQQGSPVLQVEQMRKLLDLLQPYTNAPHEQTRVLVTNFVQNLHDFLALSQERAATGDLPLTWGKLQRVIGHLGLMQNTIRELRKLSRAKSLPRESRLPMALFTQMSLTMPTLAVWEFLTTGNRLLQRRWALLYELEKNRPVPAAQATASVMSGHELWGLAVVVALGALGSMLLGLCQRALGQSQDRCRQMQSELQRLEDRCVQLEQSLARQRADSELAVQQRLSPLTRELSDMLGRTKSAQLRFDSGHMLELAAQDLAIVHEKLQHWQQLLSSSSVEPHQKARHG